MKTKIYLLILSIGAALGVNAQPTIPNAGFEIWDTVESYEAPINWFTTSVFPTTLQKVTEAHSGTYAARLNIDQVDTAVISGNLNSVFGYGPTNPIIFYAWIKTNLRQHDRLLINVVTSYKDTHTGIVTSMGSGSLFVDTTYNDTIWRLAAVHLNFDDSVSTLSDSSTITFSFSPARDTGSYVMIDDVSYSDVETAVKDVNETTFMENIFPNPATDVEHLVYSVNERSPVLLEVFDVTGHKVEPVVNETQDKGIYRADIATNRLASGMYIAVLQCRGNIVQQKFMVQH